MGATGNAGSNKHRSRSRGKKRGGPAHIHPVNEPAARELPLPQIELPSPWDNASWYHTKGVTTDQVIAALQGIGRPNEEWQFVAYNPSTPPEVLAWITDHCGLDSTVAGLVTCNPTCSVETLVQMLRYPSSQVRQTAANNKSLPRAILAMWQLTRR
jgi:hypothetical protein